MKKFRIKSSDGGGFATYLTFFFFYGCLFLAILFSSLEAAGAATTTTITATTTSSTTLRGGGVRRRRRNSQEAEAASSSSSSSSFSRRRRRQLHAYEKVPGVYVFDPIANDDAEREGRDSGRSLAQEQQRERKLRSLIEGRSCTLWKEDVYYYDHTSLESELQRLNSASGASGGASSSSSSTTEEDEETQQRRRRNLFEEYAIGVSVSEQPQEQHQHHEGEGEGEGGSIEKWTCKFEVVADEESGVTYPHSVDIVLRSQSQEEFRSIIESPSMNVVNGKSQLRWFNDEDVRFEDEHLTTMIIEAPVQNAHQHFTENGAKGVTIVMPLSSQSTISMLSSSTSIREQEGQQHDETFEYEFEAEEEEEDVESRRRLNRRLGATTRKKEPRNERRMLQQYQQAEAAGFYNGIMTTTGVKRALVIRVVGAGIGPDSSREQLYEEVFGDYWEYEERDPESGNVTEVFTRISAKTQMNSCSLGKLQIEPFRGMTTGAMQAYVENGVVELQIRTDPYRSNEKRMENDVMVAARYVFGDLTSQFDLVLFAMPPGISPPFAAYAYIQNPLSFYSNLSIENVMIQMHEIGHNLGLQHSGESGQEYGDSSGYMGYSGETDPQMCYNAANNYQLGWYTSRTIYPVHFPNSAQQQPQEPQQYGRFYLTGVAAYTSSSSSNSDDDALVTLRMRQYSSMDYYLGYNWASGMNRDTQEDPDKLIVVVKGGDISSSEISWKIAAIDRGQYFNVPDYDRTGRFVKVTFSGYLNDDYNTGTAIVDVEPEMLPTNQPSLAPTTVSPTDQPTLTPSTAPSNNPTINPTNSPTLSPTTGPPTRSPTAPPTSSPTASPTTSLMPTFSPTSTPLFPYYYDALCGDDPDTIWIRDNSNSTESNAALARENGAVAAESPLDVDFVNTTCVDLELDQCDWVVRSQDDGVDAGNATSTTLLFAQDVCRIRCGTCPDLSHVICEDKTFAQAAEGEDPTYFHLIREDVEVDENTTDPILATSFGNYTYDVVNTCNYFIVHPDRCHSLVLYDDSSNNNETTAAVDDSPRYGYEECPVSCRACPYGTCRDAHPFVDEIRGTFNVKVITVIEPEVEGEPATRTITNATGVSCDWAAAKDVESRCNFRILEPPPLPNEGAADGDEVITKFVKDECPVTCGSCPTLSPTVSPSLSPTERCNAETEVEIEILLKTNNEPQQISWRIDVPTAATEEVENAVVRYARKGSYSRPNTEEREYVCLKYDTDYRFKIWSDTTDGGNNDDDDKVMYMATYVDNPTTTDSIFLNQDRFDEKRTEKFRTRSKE